MIKAKRQEPKLKKGQIRKQINSKTQSQYLTTYNIQWNTREAKFKLKHKKSTYKLILKSLTEIRVQNQN